MSFPNRFRARRFSRLESLESRTLLAADLSVALVGDTLTIEGDDSGFQVAIIQTDPVTDPQQFYVEVLLAFDSSPLFVDQVDGVNNINVRTGDGGDAVLIVFETIGGGVDVRTAGGTDEVLVLGVSSDAPNTVAGDLILSTGSGESSVFMSSIDVLDDLFILGGNDADVFELFEVGVSGDTFIFAGNGIDGMAINNTPTTFTRGFGGTLGIFTGDGEDNLQLVDVNAGELGIFTGGQDDLVSLLGVHVTGTTLISTGGGEDTVEILPSTLSDSEFGGLVIVQLGSGDDSLSIEGAEFQSYVLLLGGSGTDDLEIDVAFDGFENLET